MAAHARYQRKGDDLHVDVPVDLFAAVLEGETIVETLGGDLTLKIPAGTQSNQLFRLRGKGMPKLRGAGRGDLYARVVIQIPTNLTDREQKLFNELAALRKR